MHACPVTGCRYRTLPDTLLMCREHWRMVPGRLRKAVWAAYRDGEGVGSTELLLAQSAATAAVDAQLGRAPS